MRDGMGIIRGGYNNGAGSADRSRAIGGRARTIGDQSISEASGSRSKGSRSKRVEVKGVEVNHLDGVVDKVIGKDGTIRR